jgi:hypothetical protein
MRDVVDCKQSRRVPGSFKLLVYVNRELKRYDFEAEKPQALSAFLVHSLQEADAVPDEIIGAVLGAKQRWKQRGGTEA